MLKKIIAIPLSIVFVPMFYSLAFSFYITAAVIPLAVLFRVVTDAMGWQNPIIIEGVQTLISPKGVLIIILLLILAAIFFFLARLSVKLAHFFIQTIKGK